MKILVVDDDSITRDLLATQLSSWGHTVSTATNGTGAWESVQQYPPDIVVSDRELPGMSGLELFQQIRNTPSMRCMYLIMVSVHNTRSEILHGLQNGADDYVTKPVDLETLRARISIGARIVSLERRLELKIKLITTNHHQTIRMLSRLMDVFDEELGGHCSRTAELAVKLAKMHPEGTEADIPVIETAARLHDIGKVGVPASIRCKSRTEMVENEQELYQSHAVTGARIIGEIQIMKPEALLIRMHHEQYNGKGFPDGVAGDQIPLGAQIISAASMYDNLRHRAKVPLADIPDHLHRLRGYQLSPALVTLLIALNDAQQNDLVRQTSEERRIDDLFPGMRLADNVRTKTGAFVMAAGTMLGARHLEKLKQYHAIGTISDKVLIHTSSARH